LSDIIGEIKKNSAEKIVVSIGKFKGKQRIDIRTYFLSETEEEDPWKPTKKGINLDSEQWNELKKLIEIIDEKLNSEK
jgi:hypothetical protein